MSSVFLGKNLNPSEKLLEELLATKFASRLFAGDSTLWGKEAEAEASIRLGWINIFDSAHDILREAEEQRTLLRDQGVTKIVLSGMGGSSLAPETITKNAGVRLHLLDSTHPTIIKEALTEIETTALVVSSKSGSTTETRSHLATFETAFKERGIDPAARITVVTDPDSELEKYAKKHGYRVYQADPTVGGRYSALTAFGLVPSTLAGADCHKLVADAKSAVESLCLDSASNPGLILGACLAAQLPEAYILGVTAQTPVEGQIADWIEQLIAESTGKQEKGVLPVHLFDDSFWVNASAQGTIPANMIIADINPKNETSFRFDRSINVTGGLGAQFMLWEVATVALGHLIGVNPFDQPDVESSKVAAKKVLATFLNTSESSALTQDTQNFAEIVQRLKESTQSGDYLVIQAFLHENARGFLEALTERLFVELQVPVSFSFGPRYLHSTGQFHKGGPRNGVFLQIVDDDLPNLEIPNLGSSYGDLFLAQAKGDREVLEALGRPVFTVSSVTAFSSATGLPA